MASLLDERRMLVRDVTLVQWRELRRALEAQQEQAVARREKLEPLRTGFLVLGVLALVISPGFGFPVSVVCAGVALALLVAGLVVWSKVASLRAEEVPNAPLALATEVLTLLDADLARDASVQLTLDFGGKTGTRQRHVGAWQSTVMHKRLMELRGTLCNDMAFAIVFTEFIDMRVKSKRSASGKIKHKRKTLTWVTSTVKLRAEPQVAQQAVASLHADRTLLHLPRGAHGDVRVTRKGIAAQAWTESAWRAPAAKASAGVNARDLIAMPLVSLFQALGRTRPTQRSA